MVMERRGNVNPHSITNGRHIKKRFRFHISYKNLYRITIAWWLITAFTAGATIELFIDRLG